MIACHSGATAVALCAQLRNGLLDVETVARACLDRIAARDPLVHAWAEIDPERVLGEAQRLDAIPPDRRGPLHGVPMGIKDVLLTRDMPTRYGSALYRDFAPTIDAASVAVLRAAGALLLGKTHTVEFAAIGAKPPTRNPCNLEHTPGGSSSGSAAAVADGHVPLALGTQTGGSIIRPASFCGTWALKPTWGLVDRDGAKMFANSLDTIGWFGRSPEDLALLLDVFDPAPGEVLPCTGTPLRVALCQTPMWRAAQPETHHAFATVEAALRAAGAHVTKLVLPFDTLATDHETIMFGEGQRAFLAADREHGSALNPVFRAMVARAPHPEQLLGAYDRAARARTAFDDIAGAFDVVVAPSTPGAAPHGLANGGSYAFNGMWTLLHTPCVNIPGFVGSGGLPVGLTVTGRRFADSRVVAIAGRIAEALANYARN